MTTPTASAPLVPAGADPDSGSIQHRVYLTLKTMVADGRLRSGERLVESRVAEAFGVSRSPIRATLARLERERVLRKATGHGYLVAGPAPLATLGRLATLVVSPLQSAPLWERVYAEVEQHLAQHVLFRSVRVTEERLAEHFGVSRTVARDVLARMHAVGLVAKDRLGRWQAECLTPERIRHLYELRGLIEPAALRQAAASLPAGRLRAMAKAMRSSASPTLDAMAMDRLEQALHIELLECCPNRELLRALEPTRLLLILNRYLLDLSIDLPADEAGRTQDEHLDVIDRLVGGDIEGAANTLERHLRRSSELWKTRYRQAERTARFTPLPPWLIPADSPLGAEPQRTG